MPQSVYYTHSVVRSSCFILSEASSASHPYNGGCFETLNLLHVSSCEMFTFCNVLHETK